MLNRGYARVLEAVEVIAEKKKEENKAKWQRTFFIANSIADLGKFEDFWNQSETSSGKATTEEAMQKGDKIMEKFQKHGAVKQNYYKEKQHGS